jgi:DinB family protein
MQHSLPHTIALLARTPAALNALLRDLPEEWTHQNEGANTWSPFDIIGHLIEGERSDWMTRARIILQYGETLPFDRFDRTAFAQMRQDVQIGTRLDEFARLRAANLDELRALNLQPADLEKRGSHPRLGSVTLSQLIATWAAHDLTHLHQLSRVMAHQYREAVGPWTRFLGVLHCDGHSA